MYTEEPRRNIDWSNIIKKGLVFLVIAIIVFLIIWLFARNNSKSNSINVDYGNENSEIINNNAYSESFIDNYRYFHDTAKEYILVNELPKNGKTLKYTLQELINKKLILPMSYDKSTCDTEASYATVVNNNETYTMTITLVCGTEVAKTTEELGCNQLCTNGSCATQTIKETIYQYKQAYEAKETAYSCPNGYTKTGTGTNTKCVKNDSDIKNATKNVTYTCKEGFTKIGTGENSKCIKEKNETIDATKTVTYICQDGYTKTGTGENTKCTKTTKDSYNATANTTYSCPNGGSLNGTKCVKSSSYNATPTTTYSCSKGELVNEKYCRTNSTSSYYDSTTSYKGKNYNGCSYSGSYTAACSTYKGCTKTYYSYYCTKSSYKETDATPTTTYSCPNGGSLNGTKCYTSSSYNANSNTTYSCQNKDKLDGTKCYKTVETSVEAEKNITYTCKEDYKLSGTKCTYKDTTTIKPIKTTTYVCPNGYNKSGIGSNSKCTKESTETINATKSTKTVTKYKYTCSKETSLKGWTKTGKTCTKETSSK